MSQYQIFHCTLPYNSGPHFATAKAKVAVKPKAVDSHGFGQGRAVKFYQLENKRSCAQLQKFFCSGVGQKVLGLGVLGLKYHVLGLKFVVSDHSNCS